MSYLQELHAAHKARIARMGGKTPKIGPERKVVPNQSDDMATVSNFGCEDNALQRKGVMPNEHTTEAPPASEPVAPARASIPRSVQQSFLLSRDIIRITCAAFNVQPYQLTSKDRRVPICHARQVVVYLMRKYSNLSWIRIGQMLSGQDTSTMRHSRSKIRRMLESDPELMAIVENIEREIAELPRE